ncbi:MAG: very short patch repair endonuclease [Flavobacterium sp. BFFFF1]|uniref:very short patch repair endonuclease n=1 Tax=Flavobacterium sp. BFFFF1 TaxID=2015557 RepID=UPI000BD0B151|nr:very short patch repair endonuclease [Flavobacterium sp. BFFFF1]OYU81411.1 MAG: very short patch repair endonuclease [Flavobacterium sp. BFFFF1]
MDPHSKEQRSKNMAAIKATATKDEVRLQKALWALGYRYRKNNKTVFGKPDITFKKLRIAIFVDSEFFHGKDFETKKKPVNNAEFWDKKIRRNIERDNEVNTHLIQSDWTVLRFWTNQIKKDLPTVIATIEHHLSSKNPIP